VAVQAARAAQRAVELGLGELLQEPLASGQDAKSARAEVALPEDDVGALDRRPELFGRSLRFGPSGGRSVRLRLRTSLREELLGTLVDAGSRSARANESQRTTLSR
jgi:hypothetical protein